MHRLAAVQGHVTVSPHPGQNPRLTCMRPETRDDWKWRLDLTALLGPRFSMLTGTSEMRLLGQRPGEHQGPPRADTLGDPPVRASRESDSCDCRTPDRSLRLADPLLPSSPRRLPLGALEIQSFLGGPHAGSPGALPVTRPEAVDLERIKRGSIMVARPRSVAWHKQHPATRSMGRSGWRGRDGLQRQGRSGKSLTQPFLPGLHLATSPDGAQGRGCRYGPEDSRVRPSSGLLGSDRVPI